MSAVAAETQVEEIELWELHSELVLVSPEVCRRALELLPERDPDAFLARPRGPVTTLTAEDSSVRAQVAVALRYTLWRVGESVRFGLAVMLGAVGIPLLAELVR